MSDQDESHVSFSADTDTPEVPGRRPYALVFVSDLGADDRLDRLTPVDKETLAEVLGRARPTLAVALKPPFGDGPDWEFELRFDSLKSFEPAGLLPQVPAARPRLAIWEKIRARRLGQTDESELATALSAAAGSDPSLAWLQAATGPAEGPPPGAGKPAPGGGSILDLVDEPDEARRVADDVERLAADAGDPSKRIGAAEGGRLDQCLQRLQVELTSIADALLRHPDLHRLETAWRGLRFLVEHIDFRAGVELAVLHATRDQAVARFNERVVGPAFDGDIPTPGLVLFDYPCENTPVDIAMLDQLGRHAAGLPVPVAFPLEATFFGVKSANLIRNLPNLSGLVDGWEFAKWRSLREQGYSRWLVPVLGRFVLRPPHEAKSAAREFTCPEKVTGASQLVWGGGHLGMGVCAARAYARHGWPARMFGAEAGKLADLPVVPNPANPERPWGPGDAVLPDRRLDELPVIGVNLLQSVPKSDYCLLLGGVTAAKPVVTAEVGQQQAALEVSLPYQQFSNITGAWLYEQLPTLRGLSGEDIQKRLILGLRHLLQMSDEDPAEAVMVGAGPSPDDPTQTLVHVQITPPGYVAPGGLQVDFNFTISS